MNAQLRHGSSPCERRSRIHRRAAAVQAFRSPSRRAKLPAIAKAGRKPEWRRSWCRKNTAAGRSRARGSGTKAPDRKRGVEGKRVSVRVDPGGRRILNKKKIHI